METAATRLASTATLGKLGSSAGSVTGLSSALSEGASAVVSRYTQRLYEARIRAVYGGGLVYEARRPYEARIRIRGSYGHVYEARKGGDAAPLLRGSYTGLVSCSALTRLVYGARILLVPGPVYGARGSYDTTVQR